MIPIQLMAYHGWSQSAVTWTSGCHVQEDFLSSDIIRNRPQRTGPKSAPQRLNFLWGSLAALSVLQALLLIAW